MSLDAIRAAIAAKTYTPADLDALLAIADDLQARLLRAEQGLSLAVGALEHIREQGGEAHARE